MTKHTTRRTDIPMTTMWLFAIRIQRLLPTFWYPVLRLLSAAPVLPQQTELDRQDHHCHQYGDGYQPQQVHHLHGVLHVFHAWSAFLRNQENFYINISSSKTSKQLFHGEMDWFCHSVSRININPSHNILFNVLAKLNII